MAPLRGEEQAEPFSVSRVPTLEIRCHDVGQHVQVDDYDRLGPAEVDQLRELRE